MLRFPFSSARVQHDPLLRRVKKCPAFRPFTNQSKCHCPSYSRPWSSTVLGVGREEGMCHSSFRVGRSHLSLCLPLLLEVRDKTKEKNVLTRTSSSPSSFSFFLSFSTLPSPRYEGPDFVGTVSTPTLH